MTLEVTRYKIYYSIQLVIAFVDLFFFVNSDYRGATSDFKRDGCGFDPHTEGMNYTYFFTLAESKGQSVITLGFLNLP